MKLSSEFIATIKLADRQLYKIAQAANVDASYISKAIHQIIKIKPDDPRLSRVARVLDFPEDQIFESDETNANQRPQA